METRTGSSSAPSPLPLLLVNRAENLDSDILIIKGELLQEIPVLSEKLLILKESCVNACVKHFSATV